MIFQFKPLRKADLPMLFEWLKLPHVVAWWREINVQRNDYQAFTAKYTTYITSDCVGPFVIYDREKPIGYISWYDAAECPVRTEQYQPRTYGMDLFIADLDYMGKGYGALLIKQFIADIMMPLNPTKIIIDPEITNVRAIHVYEKVGFRKTNIVQATDGTAMVTAQLMELDIT